MIEIRKHFLDTTGELSVAFRKRVVLQSEAIQIVAAFGIIGNGINSIVSLVSFLFSPNLGDAVNAISRACGVLISREVFIVARNIEMITLSKIHYRAIYVLTTQNFVRAMTKDTLFLNQFQRSIAYVLDP